jgi:hypothetical protein
MVYTEELTVHEHPNFGDNKARCWNFRGKDFDLKIIIVTYLPGTWTGISGNLK